MMTILTVTASRMTKVHFSAYFWPLSFTVCYVLLFTFNNVGNRDSVWKIQKYSTMQYCTCVMCLWQCPDVIFNGRHRVLQCRRCIQTLAPSSLDNIVWGQMQAHTRRESRRCRTYEVHIKKWDTVWSETPHVYAVFEEGGKPDLAHAYLPSSDLKRSKQM